MRALAEFFDVVGWAQPSGQKRMMSDAEYDQLRAMSEAGYATIQSYELRPTYALYPHVVVCEVSEEGMVILKSIGGL